MEKPKKTYFDHTMERALTKARFLVDDLRFIRQLHKDGRDEVAYGFTLATIESAEEFALQVRQLGRSQKIPDSEPEIQRMVDAAYKVELGFTKDGYFCMRFPRLIPGMDGRSMLYLKKNLSVHLEKFWENRGGMRNFQHLIIFRHVYTYRHPAWERYVPADAEVDCVMRLVLKNVCHEYFAANFKHYHCCAMGEVECTEVYVVPNADFPKWLEQEPNIPQAGWKLYESVYEAKKAEKEK